MSDITRHDHGSHRCDRTGARWSAV